MCELTTLTHALTAAANAILFDDDAFSDSDATAEGSMTEGLGRLVEEAEAGLERKIAAAAAAAAAAGRRTRESEAANVDRGGKAAAAASARNAPPSSAAALAASALPEAAGNVHSPHSCSALSFAHSISHDRSISGQSMSGQSISGQSMSGSGNTCIPWLVLLR